MAFSFANIANWSAAENVAAATSWTTPAAYDPTTDRVRYVAVAWGNLGVTSTAIPTLTGGGLTWVSVGHINHTSDEGIVGVFRSKGIGSSGALTFTCGNSQTATYFRIAGTEWTDADTSGTNGSGSVSQFVTDGTLTSTSPSVAITVNNSANGLFAAFVRFGGNVAATAGTGYTLIHDMAFSEMAGMIEARITTDTNADCTFSGGGTPNVCGFVIEVVPLAAGGGGGGGRLVSGALLGRSLVGGSLAQ